MLLDLKVTGVDQVLSKMEQATRRHVDAFHAALFVVAGDILTELLPGVPFRRGDLRDSAAVTRTAPAEIVFGARHALAAHELGAHKKYLQRPVSQASGSVRGRVAALVPRFASAGTTLATVPTKHPTTPKTTTASRRGLR